jgi:multidrug efflux system membrane fusion protein
MLKKILTTGVIVALCCAVIIPRVTKKKQFAEAVSLPLISAEHPSSGNIRLTSSLIGKIEPSSVIYVYPKASGEITAVNVKAGDTVNQGDVICVIDTKQVDAAKNSMDSAELSLQQAQDELSRQQILYQSDGISAQAFLQYQNNVKSAQLQYEKSRLEYEKQVEYSNITSPISGKVESCDMDLYDTVSQTNQICVISGSGNKIVSFSATERIRNYLHAGDKIEVEKDSKKYSGTVTEISTMVDKNTGLYEIKAELEEKADFSTGSEVKLDVTSEYAENVMTVPVDSVYYENSKPYVYVSSEDGIIHKKNIEAGIYDSKVMEVKSGLNSTDLVVTTWSSELGEGSQVRLNTGSGSSSSTAANPVAEKQTDGKTDNSAGHDASSSASKQ